ncbi:unknown protein [Desulfotalea psychrophila LSv54]|uniref:Uncharacterized protein n=1 Tax=Desulfotalea psychrophila (strain LSv54 / DSM 12343) TaxID=177439 RepID=Q6AND4_DESPS|nr:unknown protein [Desulfotalea psychrophila LSv54]
MIEMSNDDPVALGLIDKHIISQVGKNDTDNNIIGLTCYFEITEEAKELIEQFGLDKTNQVNN